MLFLARPQAHRGLALHEGKEHRKMRGCSHEGGGNGCDERLIIYNETVNMLRIMGTSFLTIRGGSHKYGKREK